MKKIIIPIVLALSLVGCIRPDHRQQPDSRAQQVERENEETKDRVKEQLRKDFIAAKLGIPEVKEYLLVNTQIIQRSVEGYGMEISTGTLLVAYWVTDGYVGTKNYNAADGWKWIDKDSTSYKFGIHDR